MSKTKAKPKQPPPPPQGFPLSQLLADMRISKRQLAKRSGIPLPMLHRLAKPNANPNWRTVLRLLEGLDLAIKFQGYRRPA